MPHVKDQHGRDANYLEVVIRLDNDLMRTKEDVAEALRRVAQRIEAGSAEGGILDENGNSVGHFEFKR
jgi:hypothetical protein